MDTFITTLMVIYDNINKEKQEGPRLINNKVTEKQFLAYYIYRIWIKYRKLMEDVNTPTDFRKILKYMEVPKKYHEIYLTYPMADKMPINEKQLDLIILSILKQLNQAYKVYGPRPDGSIPPESKDYKQLNKYLTGKSIENIIQDVMQVKLLVPNLSRPANVRNIWDGIDQMLDDIDVIEPVEYKNPDTEIPDSKLITSETNSNTISNSNIVQPNKANNNNTSKLLNKNSLLSSNPDTNRSPTANSSSVTTSNPTANNSPVTTSNSKISVNSSSKIATNSKGQNNLTNKKINSNVSKSSVNLSSKSNST